MIPVVEARTLLRNSLEDLKSRNSYLSIDDYAADIINVACRFFLDRGTGFISGPNAVAHFSHNYNELEDDVAHFLVSIIDDYPHLINETLVSNLTQNICLNLGWDGMPAFLDDYFYEKHGIRPSHKIDHYSFCSTSHKRYECDKCTDVSYVDREISFSFTDDKRKMSVTITPSLSRKDSKLMSKEGSRYTYIGNDSDYQFIVEFNDFEDVCFFSLEIVSRNLRIEYFE